MERQITALNKKREKVLEKNKQFSKMIVKFQKYDFILDDLTELFNRNFFSPNNILLLTLSLIEGKINITKEKIYTILFCDINGLKLANDTLGHQVSDEGIKKIANIIKKSIRMNRDNIVDTFLSNKELNENIGIRIGGDEFLVILSDCTKDKAIEIVAKRIKDKIAQNQETTNNLSLSIGAADTNEFEIPPSFTDKELKHYFASIVKKAEERMYDDKEMMNKLDSPQFIKKTIGRLGDILNLNINNDNDFEKLIKIIRESRK